MGYTNQFKTILLLGLLTALLLFVGQIFGGRFGLVIALIFALVINIGSYWFSDKIVLAMYRAKPASESEYPELHKMVMDVSQLANIPKPKVYILPSSASNAFATGRNPKNAAVACTQGIMDLLSKDELKGVIAHEISHIKNRDILIATIAATIAGIISYLATMAKWAAIFGGFGGRDDGENILSLLVLAILTPIIALIIQLAISRSREYLADESAAKMLHSGHGLATGLEKISSATKDNPLRFGNKSTASLFISSPFRMRGFLSLFSTHPPVHKRISKLKSMNF